MSDHAPAAASPPPTAATACDHVFSLPRSRAGITTPRSSAASRRPLIEQLAADDRRDHPGREDTGVEQHDERREHEHLVGDRVEQRAERGGLPGAPRDAAVEPVGRHRDAEDGRAPVVVAVEVDGEQQHHERRERDAGDRELVGEASSSGENTSRVLQGPCREPGRDRDPRLPRAARARHPLGRGLLRRRPRSAPRAPRGRGVRRSAARTAAESYLDVGEARSPPSSARARRRCIRATGSSPRTPASRAPSRTAGVVWIGPPPEAIELMGRRRSRARGCRRQACRSSPARPSRSARPTELVALGEELGYPLLVKAAAGGGGKGMRGRRVAPTRPCRRSSRAQREGAVVLRRRRPSTSSATSRTRATSRCRCSRTRTAT